MKRRKKLSWNRSWYVEYRYLKKSSKKHMKKKKSYLFNDKIYKKNYENLNSLFLSTAGILTFYRWICSLIYFYIIKSDTKFRILIIMTNKPNFWSYSTVDGYQGCGSAFFCGSGSSSFSECGSGSRR